MKFVGKPILVSAVALPLFDMAGAVPLFPSDRSRGLIGDDEPVIVATIQFIRLEVATLGQTEFIGGVFGNGTVESVTGRAFH